MNILNKLKWFVYLKKYNLFKHYIIWFDLTKTPLVINKGDLKIITRDKIDNVIFLNNFTLESCNYLDNVINVSFLNSQDYNNFINCVGVAYCKAVRDGIKYKIKRNRLFVWVQELNKIDIEIIKWLKIDGFNVKGFENFKVQGKE